MLRNKYFCWQVVDVTHTPDQVQSINVRLYDFSCMGLETSQFPVCIQVKSGNLFKILRYVLQVFNPKMPGVHKLFKKTLKIC